MSSRLGHALLLGRAEDPSTLTGRTPFWENDLLPYFVKSPITGYGYDSFWTPDRVERIAPARGWFFPDSHNSLIEVTLGLGLVGLVLYLAVFAIALYVSVRASDSSPGGPGPFVSAALVCSFVNSNLSSSQLHSYFGSFIYFMVIAYIAFKPSARGIPWPGSAPLQTRWRYAPKGLTVGERAPSLATASTPFRPARLPITEDR
jgi:O-antigen ligase